MLEMWQELFKELPVVRQLMQKLQSAGNAIVVEAQAGAGMVRVRANGHGRILSIQIDEELLKEADRETLEELLVAACNQALQDARKKFCAEVDASFGSPEFFLSAVGELTAVAEFDEDEDDLLEESPPSSKKTGAGKGQSTNKPSGRKNPKA